MRRILVSFLCLSAIVGSSGCMAVLAGAGTFVWQGNKVISEERGAPMTRAAEAVRRTFRARKITLTGDVVKAKAIQLRGEEPGGANVNVDVIATGSDSCRLEIRVGLGDKEASRQMLDEIRKRL